MLWAYIYITQLSVIHLSVLYIYRISMIYGWAVIISANKANEFISHKWIDIYSFNILFCFYILD